MSRNISKLLESIAWALFLLLVGGLWLAPAGTVHEDAWLIGAGLILLGLNFARWLLRLKVSTVGCVLGAVALAGGIDAVGELELPFFALAFLVLGASLLAKSVTHAFSDRACSTSDDDAPAERAETGHEAGGHPYRTAAPPAGSREYESANVDWRDCWCSWRKRCYSRRRRRSLRGPVTRNRRPGAPDGSHRDCAAAVRR